MTWDEHEAYMWRLLVKMREAIQLEEKSELTYTKVKRGYERHPRWSMVADEMTKTDPRAKKAVADGAFHRQRADMYSGALQVEQEIARRMRIDLWGPE